MCALTCGRRKSMTHLVHLFNLMNLQTINTSFSLLSRLILFVLQSLSLNLLSNLIEHLNYIKKIHLR